VPARTIGPRVRLTLAVLFAAACAGCDGCSLFGPSDCGDDAEAVYPIAEPFAFPLPERAFVDVGTAHFSWSHEFSGLCVAAPDSANVASMEWFYDSATTGGQQLAPPGLRFEGRVYHAAGFQPYTASTSVTGAISPAAYHVVQVPKIGLKQGHAGEASATVIEELEMSFTSSGSIDQDRATADALINELRFFLVYKKVKP